MIFSTYFALFSVIVAVFSVGCVEAMNLKVKAAKFAGKHILRRADPALYSKMENFYLENKEDFRAAVDAKAEKLVGGIPDKHKTRKRAASVVSPILRQRVKGTFGLHNKGDRRAAIKEAFKEIMKKHDGVPNKDQVNNEATEEVVNDLLREPEPPKKRSRRNE